MKKRPNHRLYVEILRRMSPEERLRKAFELSDFTRTLFRVGLRRRYPEMPESDLEALYRRRLERSRDRTA
ncbi:MAG TPA: hypothetical protein VIL13_10745 [Longimicrobiales bacterium]